MEKLLIFLHARTCAYIYYNIYIALLFVFVFKKLFCEFVVYLNTTFSCCIYHLEFNVLLYYFIYCRFYVFGLVGIKKLLYFVVF